MADLQPPITPELAQRMAELVRRMASSNFLFPDHHTEARAIAALLPAPVDPAVLACRELCAAQAESDPTGASKAAFFREGTYDKGVSMALALAAYRAGEAARG